MLEAEAKRFGIEPWKVEMSRAVPTNLIQDVVRDFRNGPAQPTSLVEKPSSPEPAQRSGWIDNIPLRPPPGVGLCDMLVDAQDAKDRAANKEPMRSG